MSFFSSGPKSAIVQQKDVVNIPSVAQAEPLGYLFGTQYMTGLVVYPSDPTRMLAIAKGTGSSGKGGFGGGTPTGSKNWYLNWFTIYSCNPVQMIYRVKIDQTHVWDVPAGISAAAVTVDGFYSIDNTTLGTGAGTIRFYFGAATDAPDPVLVNNASAAPAWPGFAKAAFDNFQVGTSPSVPNVKVLATGVINSPLSTDPATLYLNTGLWLEANLVHVIADLLTNPRYGAQLDPGQLETVSWLAAAQRLSADGIAGSGYLDKADKASSLIQTLLDHVGGQMFWSGGQYKLKLVRRDYSFADVPTIAENHIAELTLQPTVPSSQINQLWVNFPDQAREFADSSQLVPNVAHATTTGPVNPQKIERKYFTNLQVAFVAAQTVAPVLVTPPDKIQLKLNRFAGFQLEWGDVVCPIWSRGNPALDGSRVFRISSLKRPLGGAYVEAEAYEDFTVVASSIVQPQLLGAGTGGITDPLALVCPIELPYDLAAAGAMQLTDFAVRPQVVDANFQVEGGTLTDIFNLYAQAGIFSIGGLLAGAYPALTLTVDDTVGISIAPTTDPAGAPDATATDLANYWTTASVTRPELYARARLGLIADLANGNHEFIAWQSIAPSGANYRLTGIIRGLFDTCAQAWSAGTVAVFLFPAVPFAVNRQTDWADGVTVNLKAVPYHGAAIGAIGDAIPQVLTLSERAQRPYPVTNLKVSLLGAQWNPTYTADTGFAVSWIPRTRGAGIGYATNPGGTFDPSITAENQKFVVRIYVGAALVDTVYILSSGLVHNPLGDGVSRYEYLVNPTPLGNPASLTITVNAWLNGWESLHAETITVTKL